MKKKAITILTTIMLMFGLAATANAATLDVTTEGITITGTEGIKNAAGEWITVPSGVILMWSGTIVPNTIPDGWVLCNGQYGTPDLTDRFILGADATTQGTNGPSVGQTDPHELSEEEMPIHNHTIFPDGRQVDLNNASGPGNNGAGGFIGGQNIVAGTIGGDSGLGQEHSHTITNDKLKHYALAYIMKL